jgi:hypothetical protein
MLNKLNRIKDYFFCREGIFVVSIITIVGTGIGIYSFLADDDVDDPAEAMPTVSVQISTGEKSPIIKDTTIGGDFVIEDKK